MRARIRRYASLSALALLFLIVLMAAVMTAARLLLPVVGDQKQWFERQLSAAVGRPVQVGRAQAHLDGIVPHISFSNVLVLNVDGGRALLEFPSASMAVDVAGSLLFGAPRLKDLTLSRVSLHFVREQDGHIHL